MDQLNTFKGLENYSFEDNPDLDQLISQISNGVWVLINGHDEPCRILEINEDLLNCLIEKFNKWSILDKNEKITIELNKIKGIFNSSISKDYENIRKIYSQLLNKLSNEIIEALNNVLNLLKTVETVKSYHSELTDLHIKLFECVEKHPKYNGLLHSFKPKLNTCGKIASDLLEKVIEVTIDSIILLEKNRDKDTFIATVLDLTYEKHPELKKYK